jgi:hypothetical protein
MRTLALVACALSLGCVRLASLSVTQVPADRAQPVRAEAESPLLFLGAGLQETFADGLVSDLRQQCPDGLVSGVLTKHEVISWPFVRRHRVTATGWCLR